MLIEFNLLDVLSAFLVLFAVIDITGATPIIFNIRKSGKTIESGKAFVYSLLLMLVFLFGGEGILHVFGVDIKSFAIGGAIILFALALEMVLDIKIFRDNSPVKSATLIPLVFPLIAGAATFTTILSLRSQMAIINIIIAILLNCICVYLVLWITDKHQNKINESVIYIIRKFFGIILLAISIKLFTSNLVAFIASIK